MGEAKYLKLVESKLRFFLICFCAFSFLYALTKTDLIKNIDFFQKLNLYSFSFLLVLSLLIGYFVKCELIEMLDKDFDWKPKNRIERIQNEFFCLIGIGVLYYFTQVGIMVLFFPSFEQLMIHSIKMYNILFAATSFMIYLLYRITIIKF